MLLEQILTEEIVRSIVPDQEIWYLLLNYYPQEKQRLSSPLREDKRPSAIFIYDARVGQLVLHDFTTGDSFNSIRAIMYAHNITKPEALQFIMRGAKESYVLQNHDIVRVPTRKWVFKVAHGNWTAERLDYWYDYGVTKEVLKELHIGYAKNVWGRHIDQCDYRLLTGNCFTYRFEDRYKIYNPFDDPKWLSNTNSSDIFGLDSLNNHETLVITSSGKDVAALRSMFRKIDIQADVIAPQSESQQIPQIEELPHKRILLWYDNDQAGISNSLKHCAIYPNCDIIHQPSYKDPSDWIKAEGYSNIAEFTRTWYEQL